MLLFALVTLAVSLLDAGSSSFSPQNAPKCFPQTFSASVLNQDGERVSDRAVSFRFGTDGAETSATFNADTREYEAVLSVCVDLADFIVLVDGAEFITGTVWTYIPFAAAAALAVPDCPAAAGLTPLMAQSDAFLAVLFPEESDLFVFRLTAAGPELHQTLAEFSTASAAFGFSLAIDADTIAVGSPGIYSAPLTTGTVHVFRLGGGGQWAADTLLAPPGILFYETFGHSVAVDGGALAVGVPMATLPGTGGAGLVLVYEYDGGWAAKQTLDIADCSSYDNFGMHTALAGGWLAATARTGAVVVYSRGGTEWARVQILTLASSASGLSLSAEGLAWANADSDEVLVATENGGAWTLAQTLTGPAGSAFGSAVSFADGLLAVGSDGFSGGAAADVGKLSFYAASAGGASWNLLREVEGLGAGGGFGAAVSSGGQFACASFASQQAGTMYCFNNDPSAQPEAAAWFSGESALRVELQDAYGAAIADEYTIAVEFNGETVAAAWDGAALAYVAAGLPIPLEPWGGWQKTSTEVPHEGISAQPLQALSVPDALYTAVVEPAVAYQGTTTNLTVTLSSVDGAPVETDMGLLVGQCGTTAPTQATFAPGTGEYTLRLPAIADLGEALLCLWSQTTQFPLCRAALAVVEPPKAAAAEFVGVNASALSTDGFGLSFLLRDADGIALVDERVVSCCIKLGSLLFSPSEGVTFEGGVYTAGAFNVSLVDSYTFLVWEEGEEALPSLAVAVSAGEAVDFSVSVPGGVTAGRPGTAFTFQLYDAAGNPTGRTHVAAVSFGGAREEAPACADGVCAATFDIPADISANAASVELADSAVMVHTLTISFGAMTSAIVELSHVSASPSAVNVLISDSGLSVPISGAAEPGAVTQYAVWAVLYNAYGVVITDGRNAALTLRSEGGDGEGDGAEATTGLAYEPTRGGYTAAAAAAPAEFTGAYTVRAGDAEAVGHVHVPPPPSVPTTRSRIALIAAVAAVLLLALLALLLLLLRRRRRHCANKLRADERADKPRTAWGDSGSSNDDSDSAAVSAESFVFASAPARSSMSAVSAPYPCAPTSAVAVVVEEHFRARE